MTGGPNWGTCDAVPQDSVLGPIIFLNINNIPLINQIAILFCLLMILLEFIVTN